MSILLAEGFDLSPTGDISSSSYGGIPVGSYVSVVSPGIFNYGKCLMSDNTNTWHSLIGKVSVGIPSSNPVIVNFHRYFNPGVNSDTAFFVRFIENTNLHLDLRLEGNPSSFVIRCYRGTTLIGTSNNITGLAGTWFWVSVKAYVHSTSGYVVVNINGQTVFQLSNLNTRNGGDGIVSTIDAYCTGIASFGRLDNLIVCDTNGSAPFNDILSERRIIYAVPSSNGALNDFTASSGERYSCVNETSWNDDTNYIYSSTSGHMQTFNTSSVSNMLPNTVDAVGIFARLKKADADNVSIRLLNRQGSTNYLGNSKGVFANYTNFTEWWQTNPATSSVWTNSEADGCEIGISID